MLRETLLHVKDLALRALQGSDEDVLKLRTAAMALARLFSDHLAMEDAELAPVLETLDAWGPVRLQRMQEEHAAQRRMVSELLRASWHPGRDALCARLDAFVDTLLVDMAAEEADVLGADLLRDDVVGIDVCSG